MRQPDDSRPTPAWLRKAKANRRRFVFRRFDSVNAGKFFPFALRLSGFGIFRAEAVDKRLELVDLPLLIFVSSQLL